MLFDRLVFCRPASSDLAKEVLYVYAHDDAVSEDSVRALNACWTVPEANVPQFSIYGLDEKWPWEHGPSSLIEATAEALTTVGAENSRIEGDQSNYELHKYGGYTMSDILYWRAHFGSATLVGDDLGESILRRWAAPLAARPTGFHEVTATIPSLLDITWADVLDLRRSPFLAGFRGKYAELVRAGDVAAILDRYQEALELLADAVKPSVSEEVVKGVLGNLPIPVINPVGLASSARDIWKSTKLKRDFGWVFFVRELRRRANERSN